MPLPMKSYYTVKDAASYVATATGERGDLGAILDWGAQNFYGLYMLATHCYAKYEGRGDAIEIKGELVKFSPNPVQISTLNNGESISIAEGLYAGRKVVFVKSPTEASYLPDEKPTQSNRTSIVLMGPELAAFVAEFCAPLSTPQPALASEPVAPADWIAKARDFAKTYIDRHKEHDLFPSQDDVCKKVGAYLRENRIFGSHSKPLSAGYILRNAIQGEWWQHNKP
jgi:hypothetical protein